MVDAICNIEECKSPMSGDEFGMSLNDYPTKEEYIKELQEFHNQEHHTTQEEKLTCVCGVKSEDATKALDHHMKCPISGYDNNKNSPYPAISREAHHDVIIQAYKHNIDLSEANKKVELDLLNGNTFGAQESILIIDVCALLDVFENDDDYKETSLIKFLVDGLTNWGYLEFINKSEIEKFWNEFSEIIANSDILEKLS